MARFSSRTRLFCGFAIIAILICIRLGFWQINRADEKKQMVQARQRLSQQQPENLTKTSQPQQYQPVQITGRFLPLLLYLDNQHYQHQFGYDIISPFQSNDGLIVLVNRGWVPGDVTRQSLPKITIPTTLKTITGYAYYPNLSSWKLGPQLEDKLGERYLIQQLDIDEIESRLSLPLARFSLRLQAGNHSDFVRAWSIVSMSPNRHIGYAIQWFVMAFVLVIMISYFLKKQYEAKSE